MWQSISKFRIIFSVILGLLFTFSNHKASEDYDFYLNYELQAACMSGNYEEVEKIINKCKLKKMEINVSSLDLFHSEYPNGKDYLFKGNPNHIKILELLIKNGVDINKITNFGRYDLFSALCESSDKESILAFINYGVDVKYVDGLKRTALMDIILNKNLNDSDKEELVKIFIKKGVNINAKDRYKCSALMYASMNGIKDVIKILYNAGGKKEDMVVYKTCMWWFCDEGYNTNCIEKMNMKFDNQSFQHITFITIMLEIKEKYGGELIYKKRHNLKIDLDPDEMANSEPFKLSNQVFGITDSTWVDVEVLSIK